MSGVWKNSAVFFGKFVRDLKGDDSILEILPATKTALISEGLTADTGTEEECYLVSTEKGTELLCTGDTYLLDSRFRKVKVSDLSSGLLTVIKKDDEDFRKYEVTKEAIFEVKKLTALPVNKLVSYEERFIAVGLSNEKFLVVSTN